MSLVGGRKVAVGGLRECRTWGLWKGGAGIRTRNRDLVGDAGLGIWREIRIITLPGELLLVDHFVGVGAAGGNQGVGEGLRDAAEGRGKAVGSGCGCNGLLSLSGRLEAGGTDGEKDGEGLGCAEILEIAPGFFLLWTDGEGPGTVI
jgi:hypothetical protein